MTLQVIQRLFDHVRQSPDAIAFRELDDGGHVRRQLSYADFAAAVAAVAGELRDVTAAGATVLISHSNTLEFPAAFFGALAAGCTAFPVHPRLTAPERVTAATRSGASVVIGEDAAFTEVAGLGLRCVKASLAAGDGGAMPAGSGAAKMLLESSGTTGPSSIVQRSGPSLDAVARNVAESVGLLNDDVVLGIVPACHSYGVENVMLGPVWAGCSVDLCRSADTILAPTAARGFTVLPGVPALFDMLSASAAGDSPMPRLRRAYSAGAMLPRSVFDAFVRRHGLRIGQLYGMTEIGSVTFNDPHELDHDPMSVGRPMAGVRVRIVRPQTQRIDEPCPPGEEGEVAVSAPSMLTGYLRGDAAVCEPPTSMQGGFLLTGDLGRMDEAGRLTVTGRLKLVVDVGGFKVNLLEVERAICEHASVRECVVVPVAVSETVVRLKAHILAEPGAEACVGGLSAFLRPRLSAHKIPRSFELRSSFPRSATGKVLRHRL
jgi:long-chain acyl-CoA synthetase